MAITTEFHLTSGFQVTYYSLHLENKSRHPDWCKPAVSITSAGGNWLPEWTMNIDKAESLALRLMRKHGLNDWKLEWRRNWNCTFGACHSGRRTIYLSEPLTRLNSVAEVRDTILHDIAHAVTPFDRGHGKKWKQIAALIGAKPERCYGSEVIQPQENWLGRCPSCDYRTVSYRRNTRAVCPWCCDTHYDGKFTDEYLLIWAPRC